MICPMCKKELYENPTVPKSLSCHGCGMTGPVDTWHNLGKKLGADLVDKYLPQRRVTGEPVELRFQLGYMPVAPGSVELQLFGGVVIRDNMHGRVLAHGPRLDITDVGSVDYETGEFVLNHPSMVLEYIYIPVHMRER